MLAAKHLAGVITPPQRMRRRGQAVKKTEVGCSELMQILGGNTVAGWGGGPRPCREMQMPGPAGRQRVGCYAHPNISEEEYLEWVSGGKLEPPYCRILQHPELAIAYERTRDPDQPFLCSSRGLMLTLTFVTPRKSIKP